MNFVEPLDTYFGSTAAFAETGTYTHGATSTSLSGLFWNASAEQFGMEARVPKFETKTANLPSLTKGDGLVLSSGTYKIQDWEYDGTGNVVTLDLERQ